MGTIDSSHPLLRRFLIRLSKIAAEDKHQCDEYVLNPDAAAVKWFKCKLCGRTRSEVIDKEVW
jgi:hypothetical protein